MCAKSGCAKIECAKKRCAKFEVERKLSELRYITKSENILSNQISTILFRNYRDNFFFVFFILFGEMSPILHKSTVHKTASLADEGNSAYCQSSGAHNIKHI